MSTHKDTLSEVDIIFAGGGTAACVAAGRLAKANPDLKILLVEGGRNNFNDPTVTNPAVYLSHLAPDSKTALVSFSFPYFCCGGRRIWSYVGLIHCSFTNRKHQNISMAEKP